MKKLYLIGGGGHCKSCIDVIESTGEYEIQGIFDLPEKVGDKILGYRIIDTDENICKYQTENTNFLITLGQIKSSTLREKMFSLKLPLATIISPRSHVSKHAKLGVGTIIMHDALVNAGAEIGDNCIINTKALIEHDAKIGNHCHISTSAVVNGDCVVGDRTFIGSNTVLKNGLTVEADQLITYGDKV
jgi:sugar O-acyltransferase (sialic acid O-acetyltransferase NeuD family)